jgi:hypothetical protein
MSQCHEPKPGRGGPRAAVALSLAVTSSGSFSEFETHELIEAADLGQLAERAKAVSHRPPGT